MTSASKPLTPEQQKLVVDSMPSVRTIALWKRKRLPRWVQFEDLISAGYLGLVESASRFDGRCKFTTYAHKRILGAMQDYLRGEDLLTWRERRDGVERSEVPIDLVENIPESKQNVRKLHAGIDVRGLLRRVDRRAAFVVEQRHMQGRSWIDIGTELGFSESNACQIGRKAIAQMRSAA